MNDKNFKKETQWSLGHRLMKLDQKHDKNGKMYLIGDLGYNCKVTIREMMGDFNKGKWEMQIIPIKYTKIEDESSTPPQREDIVEAKKVFKAQEVDSSDVPF